jgi:hypothetical protein
MLCLSSFEIKKVYNLLKMIDLELYEVKAARTVLSRGKDGDYIKVLPILLRIQCFILYGNLRLFYFTGVK